MFALCRSSLRATSPLLAGIAISTALAQSASGLEYSRLHFFRRDTPRGANPYSGVTIGSDGALYGTTYSGGVSTNCAGGCGTVYRLILPIPGEPRATETSLYKFRGRSDGQHPIGSVIIDSQGAIYGTTFSGGFQVPECSDGCGTVFKLTPPAPPDTQWTKTILRAFRSGIDGAHPYSGLVMDAGGNLYGTTYEGGAPPSPGHGTVFKLSPPVAPSVIWGYKVIHRFDGNAVEGGNPEGGTLVLDSAGALYGTTSSGGSLPGGLVGFGTVFKLSPPVPPATHWTHSVLYTFPGGRRGGQPQSGVTFDASGALYGTTFSYGGTGSFGLVYKLSPPVPPSRRWTQTVLHAFGGNDGQNPRSGVVFGPNGSLYGTTYHGGRNTYGTAYRLTPPIPPSTEWTTRILRYFGGQTDGAVPMYGNLVFDRDGALYGVTLGSTFAPGNAGFAFRLK